MKQFFLSFLGVCLFLINSAQVWVSVVPDSVQPPPSWETGYLQRREQLLTSNGWTQRSSRGDPDNGKRYWALLMGEMYLKRNNQTDIDNLIIDGTRGGNSGIFGVNEGSFYKPFSCPGYAFYYFTYYNRITVVDNVQHLMVDSMWKNPNRGYTCRVDGKMDPIYTCNEFNSENFCWMARIGGYLMSHHFNDNTIIPDGNIPAMQYYTNWVNNWVRGTYCAGRVEWESHIYFPFCLQAVEALYTFAKDSMKRIQARAVLDWMAAETAIRWLDGHMVGPESRNKTSGYKRFDGSGMGYYYLWFVDDNNPVINVTVDTIRALFSTDLHTSGFIGHLAYRPPQVVVDIAQRKFNTPVEIHSAKPFYHLDNNNYKYWNGKNTKSRRFEFETYYLERNYTLASIAAGRPLGEYCFSEQCVWRLGVRGQAMQIFGNSGIFTNINGRCNFEQIGQYRNVMMRVIKGADKMWVAVPASVIDKGFDGNILFADLGDVYMAVRPYNSTGTSSAVFTPNTGDNYIKYTWTFSTTAVGALVLEVGTKEQHTSYANFINQIKTGTMLTSPGANQVEYISTLGRKLKMEQTGTANYTYLYDNATCATKTIQGGKYPRVWYDDVETDFNTWNIYEVVYGDNIIDSKWSDGQLYLRSANNGLKIIVDTTTANVQYIQLKNLTGEQRVKKEIGANTLDLFPNPAHALVTLKLNLSGKQTAEIILMDITGKKINTLFSRDFPEGETVLTFSGDQLNPGIYLVVYKDKYRTLSKKLTINYALKSYF